MSGNDSMHLFVYLTIAMQETNLTIRLEAKVTFVTLNYSTHTNNLTKKFKCPPDIKKFKTSPDSKMSPNLKCPLTTKSTHSNEKKFRKFTKGKKF